MRNKKNKLNVLIATIKYFLLKNLKNICSQKLKAQESDFWVHCKDF